MKRDLLIGVAAGACAGVLAGFFGVGGGVVMIPFMVAFLGATQHKAHGTSLAIMVFIALFGAAQYVLNGYIEWKLVAGLAVGSVVGAVIGARLMMKVPAYQLRRVFGLIMIAAALKMLLWTSQGGNGAATGNVVALVALVMVIGLASGVLAGMLGVGGGIFLVPGMVFFLGQSQHVAQGVSMATIVATAIAGTIAHQRQGNVDMRLFLLITPSAVAFCFLGVWLADKVDAIWLQRLFSGFLIVMGARMIMSKAPRKQYVRAN